MSAAFGSPSSPAHSRSQETPNTPEAVALSPREAAAELRAHDPDATVKGRVDDLIRNIEKAIVGKRETVKQILVGLLGRGHVLIEDVPGVGKTTLARALAKSIDCEFRRIQFTPDLLPSDVVGVNIYDQQAGKFTFHKGPLFANVILADEINRTTPRTQSALLEAMNDFQVSIDGITHPLPGPFIVLATENPIEYAGTYPLPEAQLDRFLLRVSMGYPDRDSELAMLKSHRLKHPLDTLEHVITAAEVVQLQAIVRSVTIAEPIFHYILEIAAKTRDSKSGLSWGVSPRGNEMLMRAAQAYAVLEGRKYVIPDDVKRMAVPVLAHRVIEKGRDAGGARKASETILAEILEDVPVPI